jgi:DNA processing protein
MYSINTIEGLLFRSYLTHYNLSLIHKCIRANDEVYNNGQFVKAVSFSSDLDFISRIDNAKRQTAFCLNYCKRNNIQVISYMDKNYPGELLKIKDFPPVLFVKGNLEGLSKCAAVVGTRVPSPLAADKVNHIVKTFAADDYGIISGLAEGIDTLAHKAALNNKLFTAAILPTSFDKIYPGENIELAKSILDNEGALITEQGPNYFNVANPFVLRNRITAALSQYLIPVEMSIESGTRHAVNYAFKYRKKLIIVKPNYQELDEYPYRYEGITAAYRKYRGKENVFVINSLNALNDVFQNERKENQSLLF